jgi:hypothetical protein
MNTFPQTRAGDGRGFHCITVRRVAPKPWLSCKGEVHSQMIRLVLVEVVAHGTRPLKREAFEKALKLAS